MVIKKRFNNEQLQTVIYNDEETGYLSADWSCKEHVAEFGAVLDNYTETTVDIDAKCRHCH